MERYIVVKSTVSTFYSWDSRVNDLTGKVNDLIEMGYVPIGGCTIDNGNLVQTMYKKPSEPCLNTGPR